MRLRHRLIHLLYPPACLICHGPLASSPVDAVLCADCQRAMPRSGSPICQRCGVTMPGAFDAIAWCAACRRTPLVFDQARAPWQYAGMTRRAIQQFKYHRHWRVGRWLAHEMAQTARQAFALDAITAVVPTPLHWVKRRVRGFNPTEPLAETIAHLLGKPYVPRALRRARWTRTQTRLRTEERFRNVHEAFVASASLVAGHTVLLVDDVLTSGATADACARALRLAGAQGVCVLAAARTPMRP